MKRASLRFHWLYPSWEQANARELQAVVSTAGWAALMAFVAGVAFGVVVAVEWIGPAIGCR